MKFFTPEWYHDLLISELCFSIRKSFRAAKMNEKYFNSLYASEKKKHVRSMKFISKYRKEPFDLKKAEESYDEIYKDNLEFVKTFPCEITEKIADIRIFALGVVEYSIYDEITRYCGQVKRKCDKIGRDYSDHLESFGEEIGWAKLDKLSVLNDQNPEISECELRENDLVIKSEVCDFELSLIGAEKPAPDSFKSITVLASEFDRCESGKKYKLSLLCYDLDSQMFEQEFCFDDFEFVSTEA